MHRARLLAGLIGVSLLLSATLARADETPEPAAKAEAVEQEQQPQQAGPPISDADDPTWFGMGFESRQELFRREMGTPTGQSGNGGNGAFGGPSQGGGR